MAAGLKLTRMECERVAVKTWIRRSDHLGSAVLVRDVLVEEVGRELAEEIDAMSLQLQGGDMAGFVLDVELGRRTDNGCSSNRGIGDRTITMPVFHVSIDDRGLTGKRIVGRRRGDVGNQLETELDSFDRPLELNQVNAVGALVAVLRLAAMDADKREGNTVNEDVMDFRQQEQVVDVQVERADCHWGERR